MQKNERYLKVHLAHSHKTHDEAYYAVKEAKCPRCSRPFSRIDIARAHYRANKCGTRVANPNARAITGEMQGKTGKRRHAQPPSAQEEPAQPATLEALNWAIDVRGEMESDALPIKQAKKTLRKSL